MFVECLRSRLKRCYELLSSMRFAIALLLLVCVASMLGTLLVQNEPKSVYVALLGPFWSELVLALQFNAVYSSWWFLLIMAFLVLSTSLCVARNAPKYLREMPRYKESVRVGSLRAMPLRMERVLRGNPQQWEQRALRYLQSQQWRVRLQSRGLDGANNPNHALAGTMLAARKGTGSKLGYIAAHTAIVLICLGGLIDSGIWARLQVWLHWKTLAPDFTSEMLANPAPEHTLPASIPSYRASIMVAEGAQAGIALVPQTQGFLLQALPFTIELLQFEVDYYSSGMPKLFASEVIIHDPATGQSSPHRIEVNRPLRVHGVDIFQASFADGGSRVQLTPWRVRDPHASQAASAPTANSVTAVVGQDLTLPESVGLPGFQLEVSDLRVLNVENMAANTAASSTNAVDGSAVDLKNRWQQLLQTAHSISRESELRNVGPSVQYRLRDPAGQALEFRNFMLPIDLGGGIPVYLLGTRKDPGQEFGYWRIPQDAEGSMQGFLSLQDSLHDRLRLRAAIAAYVVSAHPGTQAATAQARQAMAQYASQIMAIFLGQARPPSAALTQEDEGAMGLAAVEIFLRSAVAPEDLQHALDVVTRIVQGILAESLQLNRQASGLPALDMSDAQTQAFIQQAMVAIGESMYYPVPIAFALDGFEQVQASIFEVAKTPGRYLVYSGSALLIIGVFVMLFVRERRLWIWLVRSGSEPSRSQCHTQALMALSSNRKTMDVEKEFQDLADALFGAAAPQAATQGTNPNDPQSGATPP